MTELFVAFDRGSNQRAPLFSWNTVRAACVGRQSVCAPQASLAQGQA
jgi:hypothetical protein